MTSIDIQYNPYIQSTMLWVDHHKRECCDNMFDEYIIGKSIEEWLGKKVESYQAWRGFLPEIVSECNDDELNITFHGTKSDFDLFCEHLNEQAESLTELGYSPNLYRINWDDCFRTDAVISAMQRFIQFYCDINGLQQMDIINFKCAIEILNDDRIPEIKRINQAYSLVLKTVESVATVVEEKYQRIWQNAVEQWKKCIEVNRNGK